LVIKASIARGVLMEDIESLNLSALENALASLNEVAERYENEKCDTAVRDSVIKRFEYTYSLSLKMINRYFASALPDTKNIDEMGFNDIIRTAYKMGLLLNDLEKWVEYRAERNTTAHEYDESKVIEVINTAIAFKDEAEYLLNELKKRLS
jgi:nucleotidyltransferase substrate binding protein (TIGR01987 family)